MSQDKKKDSDKKTNTLSKPPEAEKKEANQPNTATEKIKKTTESKQKTAAKPPKSKVQSDTAQKTSKIGGILLSLALLIILAVGVVWGWQQLLLIKQSVDAVIATHSQQLTAQQQQNDQLVGDIRTVKQTQQGMAQALKQMGAQQAQLRESVQALYNELNKGRHHGWVVAETQYLIDIANHRLYLANDIAGAIAALKAADQRLRAVGDPSLLAARTALADEISQLQAVPNIDTAGYSAQLISQQNRVSDLALLTSEFKSAPDAKVEVVKEPIEEQSALKNAGNRFMSSLKDLVKIRQKEGNEIQFLPPEQSSYLRQNIRLKLEVARLALLQKDNALFHENLSIALDWLRRYFAKDAVFNAMENQLIELGEVNLIVQYPDITGSRKLLKAWISQQTSRSLPMTQPSITEVKP